MFQQAGIIVMISFVYVGNVSLKCILFLLQVGSPLSRTTVVPEVPGCIEEWVLWFELVSQRFSLPNL